MFPNPLTRKGILVLVLFIGFLGMVNSQLITPRVNESRINFHGIDVFVSEDGSANIEERFFFTFYAGEASQFEKDFEENSPSLAAWKKDYPFVQPHIGVENNSRDFQFFLNRTPIGEPTLTMAYDYPTGLVQQIRNNTQGRGTKWGLVDNTLLDFVTGGTIIIPSNTQIKFHFPNSSVVDTSLLPNGVTASGNTVTLTNFQSNALQVQYTVLAPIADPIDASKLFSNLIQSPLFIFVLIILGIGVAYVATNRKEITEKIERYVIEHSEFRSNQKREIELDLEDERGE